MELDLEQIMKQVAQLAGNQGEMDSKLQSIRASGIAGGGIVEVELNGQFRLVNIKLDPIVVEEKDPRLLEDLIKSAFAAAADSLSVKLKTEMGTLFNPTQS